MLNSLKSFASTLVALSIISLSQSEAKDSPAARKDSRVTYNGVVVDQSGESISNALVIAQGRGSIFDEVPEFSKVHTDENGKFEVECETENTPGSMVFLWAYAEGYCIRCVSPRGKREDNKLVLNPQEGWQVKVRKPDGSPAKGVTIGLYYFGVPNGVYTSDQPTGLLSFMPVELKHLVASQTNQDGVVMIKSVPRELANSLEATHPDLGAQVVRSLDSVKLVPTGSISGKIVADPEEIPVGKKISFTSRRPDIYRGYATAEIQADGSFHVPALAIGLVDVNLGWPQQSEVRPVTVDRFTLKEDQNVDVIIETQRTVLIRRQLLTSDTEAPVANAVVSISDQSSNYSRVITDPQGWLNAKIVPGEVQMQVVVLSREVQREYGYPKSSESQTINKSDHPIELDPILLPRHYSIPGRVIKADGSGLASRGVAIIEKNWKHVRAWAMTNENGLFLFRSDGWLKNKFDESVKNQRKHQMLNFYVSADSVASEDHFISEIYNEEKRKNLKRVKIISFEPFVLQIIE